MGKLKPKGSGATAPAAPATATVPAPAPAKPAGGAAAGGAAPRKAAPSGGAPRNVPPPPPPPPPAEETAPAKGVDPAVVQALIVARQARQLGQTLGSDQAKMEELETAQLKPYIERFQKVGELRAKGEIGEKPWYARRKLGLIPSDQVVRLGPLSIPIPDEEPVRERYYSGNTTVARRAGLEPVRPQKITSPSADELATPIKGARAAKQLADQYRQALGEYETERVSAQAASQDPYFSRHYLPALTSRAQDALQRVVDLKASMREYGWTEEDLKTLE